MWITYVDPQTSYWVITGLRGISNTTVAGAPTFAEVLPILKERLRGLTLYQHSGFDYGPDCIRCDPQTGTGMGLAGQRYHSTKGLAGAEGHGGHGLAFLKEHLGFLSSITTLVVSTDPRSRMEPKPLPCRASRTRLK